MEKLDDIFEYRDIYPLIKAAEKEDEYFHHFITITSEALQKHDSEKVFKLLAKAWRTFENFLTITVPKYLLICVAGKNEIECYNVTESLINILDSLLNESLRNNDSVQRWSPTLREAIFCVLPYFEVILKRRSESSNESDLDKVIISMKDKLILKMSDNENMHLDQGAMLFENLSVVPAAQDLRQETPDVKARIIRGDYDDIEHYLNLNFRLLREDMLYGLRKGLSEYKARITKKKKRINDLEFVRVYSVKLTKLALFGIYGKTYHFNIEMPQTVDWESTKRMKPGNILCMSKDHFQNIIFVSIVKRNPLKGEGNHCTILVKIESEKQRNENFEEDIDMGVHYVVLEPENYFESYRHVLSNMKMLNENNFPFGRYLVKPRSKALGNSPFSFNEESIDEFTCREHLDVSQKEAIKLALSSPVSLIQGPPGTGKTYAGLKIVKFLLSQQVRPVLIVCYTNHALDKFLEGILSFSGRLIRVGAQSESEKLKPYVISNILSALSQRMYDGNTVKNFSKSPDVALGPKESLDVALEMMPEGFPYCKPKFLKTHILKIATESINEKSKLISTAKEEIFRREVLDLMLNKRFKSALMEKLGSSDIVHTAREWLREKGQDDEVLKNEIDDLTDIMSDRSGPYDGLINKAKQSDDPWDLPSHSRKKNFCIFRSRFFKKVEEQVKFLEDLFTVVLEHIHREEVRYKYEILKNAEVIGLTTTGAAKNIELLKMLKPEVALIEEAAEVDELHIIASIPSSVKQLILIGDHKQLKPSPSCQHLGSEFNLNVSLFERLLMNNAPCVPLAVQRRMRPSIRELLSPLIYKNLVDHSVVMLYDDIQGMKANIFFINHEEPEVERDVEKTHYNLHEAKFVAALTYYLVNQQGYSCGQITVLTMYSGQQKILSQLFELKDLSDVHVSTVDGFQGEENHIVIVSFVRSNDKDEIGFLESNNRVCVALSRAMGGLYCIGNFELYSKKDNSKTDNLWFRLVEKLKTRKEFGEGIPLKCGNGEVINVSSASDFVKTCSDKTAKCCIDFYESLEFVSFADLMKEE